MFKYTYEHYSLPPTLVVLAGQKYIMPTWQKVHPETTLADIEWIKPVKIEVPVEKNTWTFESSSDPGHFYTVKQSGLKYSCNCPGVWRSKIRKCKHILKVENDNNKITWYKMLNGYIACHLNIYIHQVITGCIGNGKGTTNASVDHIDRNL